MPKYTVKDLFKTLSPLYETMVVGQEIKFMNKNSKDIILKTLFINLNLRDNPIRDRKIYRIYTKTKLLSKKSCLVIELE